MSASACTRSTSGYYYCPHSLTYSHPITLNFRPSLLSLSAAVCGSDSLKRRSQYARIHGSVVIRLTEAVRTRSHHARIRAPVRNIPHAQIDRVSICAFSRNTTQLSATLRNSKQHSGGVLSTAAECRGELRIRTAPHRTHRERALPCVDLYKQHYTLP